jgi:pimeloyl-ACP methyl ester carboxylesterase
MPPSDSSATVLSSVLPWCWRAGAVTVGIVAVAGGILYAKQDSLLYFPEIGGIPKRPRDNPRGYRSPDERNIPFDNLRIPCADGVHIHAWFLPFLSDQDTLSSTHNNNNNNTPTLIFFHGNAGNIGLRLPNALQMVQNLQAHVLLVEYRGYGDSDPVPPTEAGLRRDAEAALHYLLRRAQEPTAATYRIDPQRIFVFGRSLGGAVALHLADYAQRQQIRLAGVVVENTFTSIADMVDQLMPFLTPIKPFVLKIGWDSTTLVPSLTAPLLYLAGSADELVPPSHMQRLYRASKSSRLAKMHVVDGGTHNETWLQGGAAYWHQFRSFLAAASATSVPGNGTPASTVSQSAATEHATVPSMIPTMSNRFVDLAKEAVTGQGVPVSPNSQRNKKIE